MAYGEKYRMTVGFLHSGGGSLDVRFWKKDFVGDYTAISGGPDPVIYSMNRSGDDLQEPLKPTSVQLTLFSPTLTFFDEFFDIEERQWMISISTASDLEWSWNGFLNDEIFQQEYKDGKFYISLTATDCMSILKNAKITSVGRVSLFSLVEECLVNLGLYDTLGVGIIDAINVYEDSMDTAKGVLEQTYFDASQFTKDSSERWTCEEVMKEILSTFAAHMVLVTHDGSSFWLITNIESYYAGLTGFVYTIYGLIGSYSYAVQKTISSDTYDDSHVILLTGGRIEKRKGWKECSIKQNLGKKKGAVIPNGDFEIAPKIFNTYQGSGYDTYNVSGWELDPASEVTWKHMIQIGNRDPGGNYLYMWNINGVTGGDYIVRSLIANAPVLLTDNTNEYIFSLNYAIIGTSNTTLFTHYFAFMVECHLPDTSIQYLDSNGEWSSSETWIKTEKKGYKTLDGFGWVTKSITTDGFPGGRIRVRLKHVGKGGFFRGVVVDNVRFSSKTVDEEPGIIVRKKNINANLSTIPDEVEFQMNDILSDYSSFIPVNYTNYLSLADGTPTTSWESANFPDSTGTNASATLAGIYLDLISVLHKRSILQKTIQIKGFLLPNMVIIDENAKKYMITQFSGSLKTLLFNCEIAELINPGEGIEGIPTETTYPIDPILNQVNNWKIEMQQLKDKLKKYVIR